MARLWTRSFTQLTLVSFFLFAGFYMLLPALPLYIQELTGSDAMVGLAGGLFTLFAVVFRPLVGGLLDRHGRRRFILWGLALFAAVTYLYGVAAGIIALLALRVVQGVSWAFSTTAVIAAITDVIPAQRRAEGMGWYGMAMTLAMAVGPMISIWVVEQVEFGGLFLISAALPLVALLLAATTPTPFQPKTNGRKLELFEPAILPLAVTVIFLSVGYGATLNFLPLYTESLDVNAGMFFLVYSLALLLVRPVAGRLADRFGEAAVISPGLLVTAAALFVLSTAKGPGSIVISAVLYGIGFGSAQPALQAATIRLVGPERTGVANASFLTAFDLGIAVGSMALGWVAESLGYRSLFMLSAGSVIVALLLFSILGRRSLQQDAPAEA